MPENPYRFTGPLDPVKHELVCAPRSGEITKVISGIKNGDYWSIIGPSQIGKTTLLKQLIHILHGYYYIYIDMESTPGNSREFYEMLIKAIIENIPAQPLKEDIIEYASEANFYEFLKIFKAKEEKAIICLFDEIEKAYSVNTFLHLWRRVFHERDFDKNLQKYSVIAAGKAELSSLTAGEDADTSPFNIAQTLNLAELSREDSDKLISAPHKSLGIEIELEAKERIISKTKGHPQLLQHLCHMLIESCAEKPGKINKTDVDAAVERLFLESTNIKTLSKDIKTGKIPADLLKRILKGEKIGFIPYQDFAITGSGPIVNRGRYCAIRNDIYSEFLEQLIEIDSAENEQRDELQTSYKEEKYKTTIFFHKQPVDFDSEEEESKFLRKLFASRAVKIEIEKTGLSKKTKELTGHAKNIFCYLAYKNYKAISKEGFSDWEKIPVSYKYRLSSNVENNKVQKPEWQIFIEHLAGINIVPNDQDIRQWKLALQRILDSMGMGEIIETKSTGIKGYLLKGTVHFSI